MKNCAAAVVHTPSRIPSLDGLRAISIAMVLAAHCAASIPALAKHPVLLYTIFNGNRGVTVFFVISGFLITSLLLKEEESTGKISLKNFYIRRVFRILPPFWAFLAVVALLWKLGTIETSWSQLAVALAFVRDYIPGDWWTGHSWSLSIEEQFYLLWPATLVLSGKRRLWIALGLSAAAPLIRVLSQLFLANKLAGSQLYMFHVRVDSVMFGCALAIMYSLPELRRLSKRILKWPVMLAAIVFFVILSGLLMLRFQGYYMLPFGYTLENIAISYLLLYFVTKPASWGGRILNSKALVHVGLISYSLYLWQELFLTSPQLVPIRLIAPVLGSFPFNLILAFLAAELSWKLVELPALKLRRRFEHKRSPMSGAAVEMVTRLSGSAEIAS